MPHLCTCALHKYVPNYFLVLFRKSVHSIHTYTSTTVQPSKCVNFKIFTTLTNWLKDRQTDTQMKVIDSFVRARGKNAKHDQALEQLSLYVLGADTEYKGQMMYWVGWLPVALFPDYPRTQTKTCFSILQVTESWAGPGNEARLPEWHHNRGKQVVREMGWLSVCSHTYSRTQTSGNSWAYF